MAQNELRITQKTDPVVFSIRVERSLMEFYDALAGKTNRSRNELISMALEFAKDKIIVEESTQAE